MSVREKAQVRIRTYLKIITKNKDVYYFQNFSTDAVNWQSKDWSYIAIDVTPPPNSADLDNISVTALLPNIPIILQALKNNDGFRDSIVFLYLNYSDNFQEEVTQYLMSVRSTKISGASIEFTLQSPFNAAGASFPSTYYVTGRNPNALRIIGYVPEVPLVARVNLG